jgi:hypothetical protein
MSFASDEEIAAIGRGLLKRSLPKHWLLAYWTRERLFSVDARRGWTEPDLKPLPF